MLRPGIVSLACVLLAATDVTAGSIATHQHNKGPGASSAAKAFSPKEQRDINLLIAILRQDLTAVRKAIEAGADLRAQEPPGGQRRSALSLAAYIGNEAIVRLLLEKGAPVNGYPWIHAIPLAGALDNPSFSEKPHQTGIVRLLLDHGADPNFAWGDMSSGEAVIFHKRPDILELMIKHGLKLDVPIPPSQHSLLEFVIEDGNVELTKLLLASGANPNALDQDGCSLLVTVTDKEIRKELIAVGGKEIVPQLPAQCNLSSPSAVVTSLQNAINSADVGKMALCILRGRPQDASTRMAWLAAAIKRDGISVTASVKRVEERGDTAVTIVETDFKTRDGKPLDRWIRLNESLTMHRSGGRWRVTSYAPGVWDAICFLNELTYDFSPLKSELGGDRRLSPLEVVDAVECRNKLGFLMDGVIRYANKHGGKLDFSQQTLLARATPEFAAELIGRCRRDGSGKISYIFNERLAGTKLSAVKDPEYAVLLYEGTLGKPAFRHGGQAMVAFCSGRFGLVSRDMIDEKLGSAKKRN